MIRSVFCTALLAVLALAPVAGAGEGEAGILGPIPLAGAWQTLAGREKDDVAADPAKFEGWAAGEVPGKFADPMTVCTWYLKRFQVPAEAKGLDSEIVFERALWHGEVWLNGRKLGGWTDGYAPFRLLATEALKPGEENVLVAKAMGRSTVRKAKCGNKLVPAGFWEGGGGPGGILGAVDVRFFRKVRITRAQVLPDVAKKTANVSLRLEGAKEVEAADVQLEVYADGYGGPGSIHRWFHISDSVLRGQTERRVERVEAKVKLVDGVGETTVPVPAAWATAWSPARPSLYRLEVTARCGGDTADRLADIFGMREAAFKADGFYLNGEKTRLLGANIMGEMSGWRGSPLSAERARSEIIEPARRINANCIRTHGGPLPTGWLDECDKAGLMVLLEFPVTVNCAKIDFTPEELAEFKKNLEAEVAAVVPHLANHPSVIMWVMTNESNNWPEYERGPLWQLFKKLDPSRPAIRASYEAPEVFDVHSYHGMWKGSSGDFDLNSRDKIARARELKLPWMITEYLENMGDLRRQRKWLGPEVDSPDPQVIARLAEQSRDFHAQRAMEQTESSRRMGYCGVLPFGPGFWADGEGRLNFTGHAVKSALAPVGLSIELAGAHLEAGSELKTDLWVMNDTAGKAAGTVRCALVASDPGFDAAARLPKALFKGEVAFEAGPLATVKLPFAWKLPKGEGKYWLVALLECAGAAPVESRRPILVVEREQSPKALAGRKLLVLEGDGKFSAWAAGLGCQVLAPGKAVPADAAMVVVAPGAAMGEEFKKLAPGLGKYVQDGGRVLVLEQCEWPEKLKDPFNIKIERTDYDPDPKTGDAYGGSSRVWRWEQPGRPFWAGLSDEYLWRWNGFQGRVARVSMTARPDRARALARYAQDDHEGLIHVPAAAVAHGRGEILYFMLETQGRYRPEDPGFDPVVERLMVRLLAGDWREGRP